MTQPMNPSNNPPDLGSGFLYWDHNENENASYRVETPYGFELDLDFLKYVNDIQSGQTLKKMSLSRKSRGPRRSTSSLRSFSSQTGTWVSTESLDFSEDGSTSDSVFLPRDIVDSRYSGTKEVLGLRKSNPISPTPLFKLLPPPPPKYLLNASVDKTLAETRKRLEQEQLHLDYGKSQSSNLSKLSVASRSSPNLTQGTLSTMQYNKSGERRPVLSPTSIGAVKTSPFNSGINTPSNNVSSGHLQYIREQMAASLKQLKDLEEQVKVIPVLQRQISILEREKKLLLGEMGNQNASVSYTLSSNNNSFLLESDSKKKLEAISEHAVKSEVGLSKPSKIAELKRLTEKLSEADKKTSLENVSVAKAYGRCPAVKEKSRKSVAVGENNNMADGVFYYRSQQDKKDVGVQYTTETKEAGVWVMESLLGLTCEAEKEIQLLEHTIEHQRVVIKMLENHLKAASDEMEELRVAVATRTVINVQPNSVQASTEANAADVSRPPEEYLHMVDTRGLSASEMSFNGINSDTWAYKAESFPAVRRESKNTNKWTDYEKQLTPNNSLFETLHFPRNMLNVLGRDEVDAANNINKCDTVNKVMDFGECVSLSTEANDKPLRNLQSSVEMVAYNDDDEDDDDDDEDDTVGSRTLKTLDEVIMSCAQVLAS
ncbi:KN motif and ankyrin repeat domain-containing protein 1-like [Hyperolius riggenbachi]|uniref:KN motif and ankyrin repeat domain-containing protein 1-like n=1 Tax=Hyperolius riggenbachi TaxID=752182 RepID=UPI0035A36B9F